MTAWVELVIDIATGGGRGERGGGEEGRGAGETAGWMIHTELFNSLSFISV